MRMRMCFIKFTTVSLNLARNLLGSIQVFISKDLMESLPFLRNLFEFYCNFAVIKIIASVTVNFFFYHSQWQLQSH